MIGTQDLLIALAIGVFFFGANAHSNLIFKSSPTLMVGIPIKLMTGALRP